MTISNIIKSFLFLNEKQMGRFDYHYIPMQYYEIMKFFFHFLHLNYSKEISSALYKNNDTT